MGTVFSFDIRSPGVSSADLQEVLDWLHQVDARFSTYREDSEVSRLNRGVLSLDRAHHEVREVLAACRAAADATAGYFSAFLDGRLDPSGYVKGWAVQRASARLAACGSTNHSLNGGGDVVCHGRPEPRRPWRIGLADPNDRHRLLDVVEGEGPLAVATSGTAERGAHIVDPHTGRPCDELAAVSVVATNLIDADVFATAAVAMGHGGEDWLRAQKGVRALIVRADGSIARVTG